MTGALVARVLASGLNTVGATILLIAVAATGVLLTTNISFIALYERLLEAISKRLSFFHSLPLRLNAWRSAKREQARLRKEAKEAARAELAAARQELKPSPGLSPADRIAEFMREGEPIVAQPAIVVRGELTRAPAVARAVAAAAAGTQPGTVVEISSRRLGSGGTAIESADGDIEEMVKGVSFKRLPAEEPVTGKLPFDADRSRRVSYTDYSLPPIGFLNQAPPHSEQADAELLTIASRVAEKCKEFNVTGQIKHICPGPVVTTYEFKPDPGIKYSRVVSLVDDLCLALKAHARQTARGY
jgi:S-DNA-T family DNA segregation ATPase FtsK/SpoIIIE